ncbi:protein-(glutamine-N5) methyltransferase, release factor-specific [Herbaspirillum sp. CF444]|uniref:peptide chain release factor N(5)-glutamine methyltransferase n=1 Tax=Herbaspirillum sp. CF444 TaxID=1144319 RepID=UPI0002727917|nr:peptide chain release factor N(5)-glutamine methyltransferase [Herbaspirillum sp. CF444]EJL88586.1 protein-(glutamine-N5) methyltransferase, release factor-specific [Herbaspirillum sp. CF444]
MSDFPDIPPGISLADVLRGAPLDTLENRILIGHALQLTRIQLITQSERLLTATEAEQLTALFRRRLQGEPIAYIVGEREFFGLAMQVTPDVLIPRPDTELLVELALERLPQQCKALDMGTGSGAIAVAIAHTRPDVAMTALDVSEGALKVAASNAHRHGAKVTFLRSDWYAALGETPQPWLDLIVSNPPYIVAGDAHLSQGDLRFEPIGALTDHADGLSALRIIVDGAATYLKPDGWLLMEHGYDQAEAVRTLLAQRGFSEVQSWRDLAGIERVSGGKCPRAS